MNSPLQRSLTLALVFFSVALTNCGQANTSDSANAALDSSASGAAAGAVGGALSNSSSGGTQAAMKFTMPQSLFATLRQNLSPMPQAMASLFCPTFRSQSNQCTVSGSTMWLNYSACTFAGAAEWNGTQAITMSSGTATCGAFPNPGDSGTLYRQYVTAPGSNTPGEVTLTAGGTQGIVDDASPNLANFDNDTLTAINANSGYGAAVTFGANGARSAIAVGHHIAVTGEFDHSVIGNLSISENPGAASRTVSGSVKVYHNLLKVIGTATFSGVVHNDICCLPVSGQISTVYSAGTNVQPTNAGSKLVGQTETLTFTGCGTATLELAGVTTNVTLKRCF